MTPGAGLAGLLGLVYMCTCTNIILRTTFQTYRSILSRTLNLSLRLYLSRYTLNGYFFLDLFFGPHVMRLRGYIPGSMLRSCFWNFWEGLYVARGNRTRAFQINLVHLYEKPVLRLFSYLSHCFFLFLLLVSSSFTFSFSSSFSFLSFIFFGTYI